jgi:hypothetical protein
MALQIDSINPTEINATAGTQVVMSCEVSGGIASLSFATRYNGSLAQCRSLHVKGQKVYAGFGDSSGKVIRSDDGGLTFPVDVIAIPSRGVSALHETDSGALLLGTFGSNATSEIYRNGTKVYTSPYSQVSIITGFAKMQTGRLIATGGNVKSVILYSDDDGVTWDVLHEVNTDSKGRFLSPVACQDGGYLIACFTEILTSNSGAYKLTSGYVLNKSVALGSQAVVFQVGVNRIVATNSVAPYNAIYTDNCGGNWATYTTPPTVSRLSEAWVYHDGVSYVARYTAGQGVIQYSSDNGATWGTASLPAGYESVISSAVTVRNTVFLGVGFSAGDGDILEMTPPTLPLYVLKLLDGQTVLYTETNTTGLGVFGYTVSAPANLQWEATDGVTTVQSALIPVIVTEPLQLLSINPIAIDAIAGTSVVMSCETSGGSGTVLKKLVDTFDSSVLSLVSPFNYVAEFAQNGHIFRWELTDTNGTVVSNSIPINVVGILTITDQPNNIYIIDNEIFSIGVVVSGGSGVTYQWYYNSEMLVGETDSTFSSIGNESLAGEYYCVVSDEFLQTVTSDTSTITYMFVPQMNIVASLNRGVNVLQTRLSLEIGV